jgi:hypothetical protein
MSSVLDQAITWRSVIRIGLIWAAEYAMLSLIEESPPYIKVATMICAIGLLATLEFEQWLRSKKNELFLGSLSMFILVYVSFIGYAIQQANYRATTT